MRHTRTRRRLKSILTLLLIICLTVFVESRIEAFVPQIKNFALVPIETAFKDKIKLRIGSIDGGILHPIVFNDISIKEKPGSPVFSSIDIHSIRTEYRIWDVLLLAMGRKGRELGALSGLLSNGAPIYINFVTKNEKISGFLKLDGVLGDAGVKGYLSLPGGARVDFLGNVKEDAFDLEIRPPEGTVKIKGCVADDGSLETSIKAERVKFHGFDIVCDLVMKNSISTQLEGELETKSFILNYKQFFKPRAAYRMSNGVLEVSDLSIGDVIKGRGKIALRRPYNIDAVFTASNLSLNWLALSMGVKGARPPVISGAMNGKFEFKGPPAKLKSNMRIEIRQGALAGLDFESLSANLIGDGPVIRIEDSRIMRRSGYFALAGEMDLRKIGRSDMFEGIKLSSSDSAISWDEWETTRSQDMQEIRMKKRLNDEISLDFKKFVTEDRVDESLGYTDKVTLEYKLHPNDSLKMTLGQDADFLGFEHKDRF